MSNFVMSWQDVFGRYCKIANGFPVGGRQDYHIFKCVQSLLSNCYCETPITAKALRNPGGEIHDEVVDVVRVIHCGIDETQVLTVALSDIEFVGIPGSSEKRYQQLEQVARDMYAALHLNESCSLEFITDNGDCEAFRARLEALGVSLDD